MKPPTTEPAGGGRVACEVPDGFSCALTLIGTMLDACSQDELWWVPRSLSAWRYGTRNSTLLVNVAPVAVVTSTLPVVAPLGTVVLM
jgi:hypothetical protein